MPPITDFSIDAILSERADAQEQAAAQYNKEDQEINKARNGRSLQRPGYTFPQLITMAILDSPQRKLQLYAILEWISAKFPYYRKDQTSWQNQVRHTLSTNRNFTKLKRPSEDPGRGNYWILSSSVNYHQLNVSHNGSEFNGYPAEAIAHGIPMSHPEASLAVYFPTAYDIQHARQIQYYQQQYFATAQWSNRAN